MTRGCELFHKHLMGKSLYKTFQKVHMMTRVYFKKLQHKNANGRVLIYSNSIFILLVRLR